MHPYETQLWSEILALLQSVERVLNTLQQTFATYLPVVLATLVVGLVVAVVVGVAYLSNTSARPAGMDRTVGGVAVTEAGKLALLANLEDSWEVAADSWNMDQPSPERIPCN
jgi:MFS superfamily sulfate permease-like transporter